MHSQFYNGLRQSFGKNRVQYNPSIWSFYRFDQYDIYYHQDGEKIAQYINLFAKDEIERIEAILDYQMEKRIIFIAYNSLSDFRQSNIGLVSSNDESNIGGVTRIVNNRVAIYHEGDLRKLEKQISESVTEIIINEMLYGTGVVANVTNSALINMPPWFINGLKAYIANKWDLETENRVCDGILTGKYRKFNHLTGDDATYAGNSFWRYVAKTYGESVIPNIVYLSKINKSVGNAFLYVLGSPLKELSYDWQGYYLSIYEDAQKKTTFPDEGKVLKRTRKKRTYSQIRISPDSKNLAYVTNESGRYIVWVYDVEKGKTRKIFRKGHRLDQITDYSYPVLAWHPTGKALTFMIEDKGSLYLYYYTLENEELIARHFLYFDKVLDYSFAPDGMKFVMTAVKAGKSDVYVFSLTSGTFEQITDDFADDRFARFTVDQKYIVFSSDRTSDTLRQEKNVKRYDNMMQLYLYDYTHRSDMLRRLSGNLANNDIQAFSLQSDRYAYLSDATGIVNRYATKFDSTISFIDTTVHYRYYTSSYPVTNYNTNILEQDLNATAWKESEIIYKKGRYHLFLRPMKRDSVARADMPVLAQTKEVYESGFRKKIYTAKKKKAQVQPVQIDSALLFSNNVDINNFMFDKEKRQLYAMLRPDTTVVPEENLLPRARYYETYFYTNYLVNQIDFTFLNNSYQMFTGGAPYYNPGLNMFFKLGTNDLFDDYKITGGIRLAADFESNEYLLNIENLKGRKDKELIFHRQVFKNITSSDEYIKTQTHEAMYIERYPFNQVLAFKTTATLRHDRNIYLGYDQPSLEKAGFDRTWLGYKTELIFDNTKNLGLNLYSGMRFKLFAEAYVRANKFSDLFVLGADFRYYLKIHRNLILATRFAGSSSLGSSKLIYYLGGVDNWIRRSESFDRSVPVDQNAGYAFQALATNMRGFIQNARNGNNFAVVNAELRWPIIRYLANYPISSNFLNNFQIIGFCDIGSAWSGINPWAGKNAYDKQVIDNVNYVVTIDSNRDPVVAGYGFGLRSQLLGYFVRLDWAWGIENRVILPRVFYLSLSLDF